MTRLAPVLKQRFFDDSGAPLAGGKVYTYVAGSDTPRVTYSDADGTTNTNPVILDAAGEATIFFGSALYKVVLKDADDVIQWTIDDINANLTTATDGLDGNGWRYGTSAPGSGDGNDGDFYFRTSTNYIYGPKASGVWPAGVDLSGNATAAAASEAAAAASAAAAALSETAAETAETNAETAETNAASSASAASGSASSASSSASSASTSASTATTQASNASTSATNAANSAIAADASADAAAISETNAAASAASIQPIPSGGTTGQVLAKDTNTDYDVSWSTPAFVKLAGAGTGGQTITDPVLIAGTSANQDILGIDPITGANWWFGTQGNSLYFYQGAVVPLWFATGWTAMGNAARTPKYLIDIMESATSTDPATHLIYNSGAYNLPLLTISNRSSTANNWSALAFAGSSTASTAPDSYIVGVHEAHTGSAESGHLEFYTRNAGTVSKKMDIGKSGTLTLPTYTTAGVLVNNSSGVVSSVAPGSDGNVLTAASGVWTSAAPSGGSAPSIVYIKDVKSAGTHGGSSTSGSWQTRTLNTTEGDTGLVSLSSNQFTLQAGTYEIEAMAPARDSDKHRIKLRNITDSTDDLLGSSADCAITSVTSNSHIMGRITIASAKAFEIQHRVTSSASTTGYGSATNVSVDEVYTVVKITMY